MRRRILALILFLAGIVLLIEPMHSQAPAQSVALTRFTVVTEGAAPRQTSNRLQYTHL